MPQAHTEANSQSHPPVAIHRAYTAFLPGPPQSRLSGVGSGKGPGVRLLTLSLADKQTASRPTWFGTSSRVSWKLGSTQQGQAQGLLLLRPTQMPVSAGSMVACLQSQESTYTQEPSNSTRSPELLWEVRASLQVWQYKYTGAT